MKRFLMICRCLEVYKTSTRRITEWQYQQVNESLKRLTEKNEYVESQAYKFWKYSTPWV